MRVCLYLGFVKFILFKKIQNETVLFTTKNDDVDVKLNSNWSLLYFYLHTELIGVRLCY